MNSVNKNGNIRSYRVFLFCGIFLLGLLFYLWMSTVAIVGSERITTSDVRLRKSIEEIYDPNEKRDFSLSHLIQAFTRYEILKKQGLSIKSGDLLAEAQRIDQETLDSNKVKQIKQVFKDDNDSYLRLFIFPALVERKISSFLSYENKEFHLDSYRQAKELIRLLSEDKSLDFFTTVKQKGGHVRNLQLLSKTGLVWRNPDAPNDRPAALMPKNPDLAQAWHRDHLQNLSVQQVPAEPIDNQDAWVVLLLLKKEQKKNAEVVYQFKVGVFMKTDPGTWIDQESKKIHVWLF